MVTKLKNNLVMTLEQKFELLMVFSLSRELHNQKCVKIANDHADELIKIRETKILDFLYDEITERRDYSASKMCEKITEFILNLK
jgi:hypothetical protein